MTVTTDVQSIVHDTDGSTTEFPIPFYFLRNADITAELIDAEGNLTVLVLGTDFNVTGAGQPNGGALVTTRVFASGYKLHVYRVVPVTQETQYQQNDAFPAKTTEKALDKLTMLIQQQKQITDRALVVPRSDLNPNTTIPSARLRANRALGFDNNGNPVAIDLTLGSIIAPVVHSIAMLRLASKFLTSDVFVMDYYGDGNGGGGPYFKRYDNAPSGWENGGTQIVAADGAGWQLQTIGSVTTQQFGVRGDGATDDTERLRAWAAYIQSVDVVGVWSPGDYLITGAGLTFTGKFVIEAAPRTVTVLLGTKNMTAITVGDGTSVMASAMRNSRIRGVDFNPSATVDAFTSGQVIYRNNAQHVDIVDCAFYGANPAGTKILWSGLKDFQTVECFATNCTFQQLLGDGIDVSGGDGIPNRAVDCNYDDCKFFNIVGNGMFWGANTAGLGARRPTAYGIGQFCLSIASTPGPSGQNYFIDTPDFEVDGAGGVVVSSGQAVIINGGWIGAGPIANTRVIWLGANADTCSIGCQVYGWVQVDGRANRIDCPYITGDTVTTPVGLLINAGADYTIVRSHVRQFTGNYITISGTPIGLDIDVHSTNNDADIGGLGSYVPTGRPPKVRVVTDRSFTYAAASTLPIVHGNDFIQVTGATPINSVTTLAQGSRLTVQAGVGGITFNNGGGIITKTGSSLSVPQFMVANFVSDGNTLFEV
ncbi:hypothetical protein [Burkholderia cenocepacia]|uniref:hypothetical protein n=1 Tax=Burkholderia cenocepacia TaxID=95486 RepID=UPI002863810A|nr:hypothetical protein [Burkholderia cenocepacia]MDR8049590.1 hypothetical protein [Burkholderia cenocepacia]